jgi:hypothetical protein
MTNESQWLTKTHVRQQSISASKTHGAQSDCTICEYELFLKFFAKWPMSAALSHRRAQFVALSPVSRKLVSSYKVE